MSDNITNDDVIVSYMVMRTILSSVNKTCTVKTVYSRINNITKAKLYINKIHDLITQIVSKYIYFV